MNAQDLTVKIKQFVENKINIISKSNPIINFTQPFVMRIIDNKAYKITGFLNMFADETGNIDVNGLVDDIVNRLSTIEPFSIDLMSISKLEIGGGKIKMGIPLSDKCIIFNTQDVLSFKEGINNVIQQ